VGSPFSQRAAGGGEGIILSLLVLLLMRFVPLFSGLLRAATSYANPLLFGRLCFRFRGFFRLFLSPDCSLRSRFADSKPAQVISPSKIARRLGF
jgi:hypothetical protein